MKKGNNFDREMSRLEGEIKRLEVEYNMFFAGRLARLPWETRARVEQLVKQFDRMNLSNTAQRFRFGTVQARFMSFCELWERNLRAKEEGRSSRGQVAAATPVAQSPSHTPDGDASAEADDAAAPVQSPETIEMPSPQVEARAPIEAPMPVASVPPPPAAPARAVMETTRIGDLGRDSDRVTALYDELTRARVEAGEPPMPFDRFATVVKAQVAKLGAGSTDVAFRVNISHGKVTLLAKKVEE